MINAHHNHNFDRLIPFNLGDRYFAQDLGRDFWYVLDKMGLTLKDLFGASKFIIRGGVVTQGVGDSLDITEFVGYAPYNVWVPDQFNSLPPTKKTETVEVIRIFAGMQKNLAIPSATLDGRAVNYVKISYADIDGKTRNRVRRKGSYSYEKLPSFVVTVDAASPLSGEILLNTFTGERDGRFTFSGKRTTDLIKSLSVAKLQLANGVSVNGVSSDPKLSAKSDELIPTQKAVAEAIPPVGSIIAYTGGYHTDGSNGGFTISLAGANNPAAINAAISKNWRVCNGSEYFDVESPIFNVAGRFLPNLTDERFIQGSNVAGGVGGSNFMLDHTHASSNESTDHEHTVAIDHGHSLSGSVMIRGGGMHDHKVQSKQGGGDTEDDVIGGGGSGAFDNLRRTRLAPGSGGHSHSGLLSGSISRHVETKRSSFVNLSHSHSIGSGSAASGTDNRPKYFSTFYIYRTK